LGEVEVISDIIGMQGDAFFTISDARFFPGTVALLNSLVITGNLASLVILDVGLTDAQRFRLDPHATVVKIPGELKAHPAVFKAYPRFFPPSGVVVIIDSDMIISRSLGDVIARAASGKICVYPDPASRSGRWFKEWETELALEAPLRQQTYVNSGFLALSMKHWPRFLSRFWELCERIPTETVFTGADAKSPFWAADQDVLNALLMSEVPPDAVELLPAEHEVYPDRLRATKIVDARSMECVTDGERPTILHYSMAPKAWAGKGWLRVRRDAYVELFGRAVCGKDVPLRLEPRELPVWLRPTVSGWMLLTVLDFAHGVLSALARRIPKASTVILRIRDSLLRRRRS
jgi:hypothetical protein